jgi:hypothetical protein
VYTEASAATEQARQFAEKAEEEKDALRKEIVSLHARLDSRRPPDDSSSSDRIAEGGGQGSHEEAGGTSCAEEEDTGVRAASSDEDLARTARQRGHVSQQDVHRDLLSAVLADFNKQLAHNYAQVRTVLHQVPHTHTRTDKYTHTHTHTQAMTSRTRTLTLSAPPTHTRTLTLSEPHTHTHEHSRSVHHQEIFEVLQVCCSCAATIVDAYLSASDVLSSSL